MPGWHATSWGYHGDDGMKFNISLEQGLRYSKTYTNNDTVGCGINMQTGKVFFTLNGSNLGKCSHLTTFHKPLTYKSRRRICQCDGDVVSYDWFR